MNLILNNMIFNKKGNKKSSFPVDLSQTCLKYSPKQEMPKPVTQLKCNNLMLLTLNIIITSQL